MILGIDLTETPQQSRPTYSGKVVKIAIQLADEKLVSDDNKLGRVPGTWRMFTIPVDQIPETTGSARKPGRNDLPRVDLGEGKSSIYTFEVVIFDEL